MDPTAQRGVLIGLGSISAVCAAVLYWVQRDSAAPIDFFERYLGIGGRGDGSMEVLFIIVLVMIVTATAFRLASK